jgi:3-oxoacyl-[acyl-carrier-protein] synthase II
MKPVYVVDYAVIDTLGLDISSNYVNMLDLVKGPQPITRFDLTPFPNVQSTKGFEISYYSGENLLIKVMNDLVNQLSQRNQFPKDTAVVFGSFASSGHAVKNDFEAAMFGGSHRFSPTRLLMNNHDLLSANISRKLQLEGLSTSLNAACSSSMFNLHYAFNCIQSGTLSAALVGAVETPFTPGTQYYWQSTSAISTSDGGTSIPFDKKRDGFLQAEGGSLWFLCDEQTIKEYGLTPKARILSVEASAKCHDSASLTAHDKTGAHQIALIDKALKNANKTVKDMAFFNAHATSTPIGDDIEFEVFQKVFADIDIPCVSFKGYLGHVMSACGMIETAYGLEAVKNGYLHPNYNLTDPLSDDPRLITKTKNISGNTFMKTSFGFGGRSVISVIESL